MSWTVYSRLTDPVGQQWVNHNGTDWVADKLTTTLMTPDMAFPLTPTGPIHHGLGDESSVFAAALYLIPCPGTAGQLPDYPALPVSLPDSVQ